MQIANPLYDVVFKYLMEDDESAKVLISGIIGEEVETLELLPKESVFRMEKENGWERESNERTLTVYRLDFSAKIRTAEGVKNVLIEIQKAKYAADIMRFRKYLGEQYIKKMSDGPMPIVTIYFLGYSLEHTRAPVIKVNRVYEDLVAKRELQVKERFIESLTHDSYVIQIPYLDSSHKSKLESLLAIFDQSQQDSLNGHMLNIEEKSYPAPYGALIRRLLKAASEPKVRSDMDLEDEIVEELENMERHIHKTKKELAESRKALEERDKVLEEKDKVLEEKDKVLEEKDKVLEEKDKVLEEKDKVLEEQRRMIEELLKKGPQN